MPFNTVSWALRANIYEVNLRQYTKEGTLVSFAAHLPRLADMGVTVLWFMPITPISIKGRLGSLGSYYACSDYTAINSEFGSEQDFIAVVHAAHELGMKVIIDWVANHTGQDHVWTRSNPNFYIQDSHGNFTERNGWSDVIDLNFDNRDMRTAMIDAMRYWVDTAGIDGFRCDMAHLVPLDFWIEARQVLDAVKPLFWLAECEDAHYFEAFDTTYAWAFMHASGSINRHEPRLNLVLEQLERYASEGANTQKLFFTSNHDENSWNGTEYEKYGVTAKAWAVFSATWGGLPLVYSGQEIPNQKRLSFFEKDELAWSQQTKEPTLHGFYKSLLSLRAQNDAVVFGQNQMLQTPCPNSIIGFIKKHQNNVVLVLLNISEHNRLAFEISHSLLVGKFEQIFSGLQFSFSGNEKFELQAGEYLVYQLIPHLS
jgi:glycosidase